jgi:glucose-1-phosphate thymidylyltransferase
MKGIILHGGYGTRLGPLTFSGPKQLIPIANKPMSQYALEDLLNAGISEIAIIIGDVFPQRVKNYYGDGSKFGAKITYIFQDKPKGISHAIGLCKNFIGDDKFVVYLGDNILRKGLGNLTKKFIESKNEFMILLSEVDDPSRFGIAEFDNETICKIIEKPKITSSNLAVIGIYFLNPKIFPIIEKLKPSQRGELEITDALDESLKNKISISYEKVTGWWKDTGTAEDILDANRLILETLGTSDELIKSDIVNSEKILLGKNCIVSSDTKIISPVIIGDNCKIDSAQIGPNVSVGNNSKISHSKIMNSIIMENCNISISKPIASSIISNYSEIISSSSDSQTYLIGEKSKIQL